jgi:hypothetical protein
MIENLVEANWDKGSLSQAGILGNSFQGIVRQATTAERKEEVLHVCEVHDTKACLEVELEDHMDLVDKPFRETALHLLPRPDLCCPT